MQFLYDHRGRAIAYINNGVVYLVPGTPVAFLHNEYVYSYSGVQIGTYEEGRMRDLNGNCVFFNSLDCGFGPLPPIPEIPPLPALAALPPLPPIPEIPHIKAIPTLSWSQFSGINFFMKAR